MLSHSNSRGFTLVELLVTFTIVALLVALAAPSFSTMMQNSRLGAVTKSYALGLQTARAEAIRLNTPVQFVLTDAAVGSSVANSITPVSSGRNWVVRYVDPAASGTSAGTFIQVEARGAQEGGSSSAITIVPAVVSPADAAFNGTVSFNGFGATGTALNLDIRNSTLTCAPDGPMRCQRIQIRAGGQIRICDPAANAGDSRQCS